MKNGFNLAERQQQVREEAGWVRLTPCLQCGKEVKQGFYGRHHVTDHVNSGTCSLKCETLYTKGANRVYIEYAQRQAVSVGMEALCSVLPDAEP